LLLHDFFDHDALFVGRHRHHQHADALLADVAHGLLIAGGQRLDLRATDGRLQHEIKPSLHVLSEGEAEDLVAQQQALVHPMNHHAGTDQLDGVRPAEKEVAFADQVAKVCSRRVGDGLRLLLVVDAPGHGTDLDQSVLGIGRRALVAFEALPRFNARQQLIHWRPVPAIRQLGRQSDSSNRGRQLGRFRG
jgi:hypothetical protein